MVTLRGAGSGVIGADLEVAPDTGCTGRDLRAKHIAIGVCILAGSNQVRCSRYRNVLGGDLQCAVYQAQVGRGREILGGTQTGGVGSKALHPEARSTLAFAQVVDRNGVSSLAWNTACNDGGTSRAPIDIVTRVR